jgi:hypothetical protein
MSQLLTIYEGVYLYDINGTNGFFFKVNHQFLFTGKVTINSVCCGVTEAFVVSTNKTIYNVPVSKAVETTIRIPKNDQSFNYHLYKLFLQNKHDHYYGEINNNCKNCNGLVPHGDYSNNVHTGGYKDPDLVFKDND